MASKVSASSDTSSRGPSRLMRSPRDSADSLRAVPVTSCSGRSTRPVKVHASTAAASSRNTNATSPVPSTCALAWSWSTSPSWAASTAAPSTMT